MKKKVRLISIAVILMLGAAAAVSVYFLHEYQVRRNVAELLDLARRKEAGGDREKAVEYLKQYLSLRKDDGAVWLWYARILNEKASESADRQELYEVHEKAARYNPDNLELRRRCADLAMVLGRHRDASRNLLILYERLPDGAKETAKRAGLEDLLGQCDQHESRFPGVPRLDDDPRDVVRSSDTLGAEGWYLRAIAHDPSRIETHERLSRLYRNELKQPEKGDELIEAMIKANPESAAAYLARWRYGRDFGRETGDGDIKQALSLAPEDPQVLLAAAEVAQQSGDREAARRYLRQGRTKDPKNRIFPVRLAQLELTENHPAEAEAVLARAVGEIPDDLEIGFMMADLLIAQGKIDGDQGGRAWVERLKKQRLPDGHVQFLEAGILVRERRWAEAVTRLETTKSRLAGNPALIARTDLMLADCFGRLGLDEARLATLRRSGGDDGQTIQARIELTGSLEAAGRLDEAIDLHARLLNRRPESRLDILRLTVRKIRRNPADRQEWAGLNRQLRQAAKLLPQAAEQTTLLEAELLAARGELLAARRTLEAAVKNYPGSAACRSALALAQDKPDRALAVLDQAEKELGPKLDLALARINLAARLEGDLRRRTLAKLADIGTKLPPEDRPAFLDQLGTALVQAGETDQARHVWRGLAELQPDNLRVLMVLTDLAIAADDRADLDQISDRMKKIEGEQGVYWRYAAAAFLVRQARQGDRKELSEAGRLASELVSLRGDWWGGLALQGQLAELEGRPDEAVSSYTRAIELGASQPDLARRLFSLLYQRRQFDQIDQIVKKLDERGISPGDFKLITALNALRGNETERGLSLARQVLSETSANPYDLLFLGRMLLYSRRTAEAQKPLRRALDLAPGLPDAWLSYVEYQVQAKVPTERIRQTISAAEEKLPSSRASLTLAQCLDLIGDREAAKKQYQAATAAQPADPATLRLAADFYIRTKQYEKARPLLDRLLDPGTQASAADVSWANRSQAQLRIETGSRLADVDKALGLVETHLSANPYDLDDQRLRAILLAMRAGKRQEAIRALEALDRTGSLTANERFLLAMLYGLDREWPNCLASMLRVASSPQREPRHLAALVGMLIEHRELAQADRWLAQLKPLTTPENPVVLDLQTRLLKAEQRDDSIAALLKAHERAYPDQIGNVAGLYDRYDWVQDAERAYRAHVSQGEGKEPLRVLALIDFLARRNRLGEALELCEHAWKTCPPEAAASASLAALSTSGNVTEPQLKQVESRLMEAVKRDEKSPLLRARLASLRVLQGRYQEGIGLYREALALNPESIECLNNLAWQLAFEDGKTNEAVGLVNRAIELVEADSVLLDTRAVISLQSGRPEPAIEDLKAALVERPQNSTLYFHLARAHRMAEKLVEARNALKRAEELGLKPETIDPREREIYVKVRQDLAQQ